MLELLEQQQPQAPRVHISPREHKLVLEIKQDWLLNCFQGGCHQGLKILWILFSSNVIQSICARAHLAPFSTSLWVEIVIFMTRRFTWFTHQVETSLHVPRHLCKQGSWGNLHALFHSSSIILLQAELVLSKCCSGKKLPCHVGRGQYTKNHFSNFKVDLIWTWSALNVSLQEFCYPYCTDYMCWCIKGGDWCFLLSPSLIKSCFLPLRKVFPWLCLSILRLRLLSRYFLQNYFTLRAEDK